MSPWVAGPFWAVGLTLTLIGTGIACQALYADLRRFDTQPIFPRVVKFWNRLRRKKDAVHQVVAADAASITDGVGSVRINVIPAAGAALSQQVKYLRRRVDELQEEADQIRADQDQALRNLAASLRDEIAKLNREVARVHDELSAVAAGSARKEIVGLVLIGVGAVFSAVAGWPL